MKAKAATFIFIVAMILAMIGVTAWGQSEVGRAVNAQLTPAAQVVTGH